MKMQSCPECNGENSVIDILGFDKILICYVCEGMGTIPAEDMGNCAACGEPIELGLEWCDDHVPAADLWEALNAEKFIDAMLHESNF